MTICHQKDMDAEYTDEQLVEHLQSSDCSECRDAGFRLEAALTENKQLAQALGNTLGRVLGEKIAEMIRSGKLEGINEKALNV